MDSIRQDIRFAFRALRRNPAFVGLVVLILSLGVGAATAIFAIVNAVLLKPLPYAEPSRLAVVTSIYKPDSENRVVDTISLPDIQAMREQSKTISSISGFLFTRLPIRVGDTAYYPDTLWMDAELFTTLGTLPAIGTNFEPGGAEDQTAIISHAFWQRAFGGAPDVIGKAFDFGGSFRTVRGVLPADFELPRTDARLYRAPIELFLPVARGFAPGSRAFWGIARLAPNSTLEQAQAELRNIDAGFTEQPDDWFLRLAPLAEERTGAARRPLTIFVAIGAVAPRDVTSRRDSIAIGAGRSPCISTAASIRTTSANSGQWAQERAAPDRSPLCLASSIGRMAPWLRNSVSRS